MTRRSARRGFTLLELLVVVTIVATVAVLVLPTEMEPDGLHVMGAADIIASDIELAQVMTISYPDAPVVVKFDPPGNRYWLAYLADPDTPITREDTRAPYLVVLGSGRASAAAGVTLSLEDLPTAVLEFNAQGGLVDLSLNPVIVLGMGDRWGRVQVTPTTGSIIESFGETGG